MNDFVTIRLYGAARAAAGESELIAAPNTLNDVLAAIAIGNPRLDRVFEQCSFLVDGAVIHDKNAQILGNSIVDVLPPFAGG
jgi:molybdopterin synthase sulfur carrier subunit